MKKYSIDDLLNLMACLRDPSFGCPWDLKQDFNSIVSYTLEETYEVIDAIEQADIQHIKEELGDLLFQIIFYACLAEEQSHFNFQQVVQGIVEKLLRRHPHVFPDGTLDSFASKKTATTAAQVSQNWETIKQQESPRHDSNSLLDDVPKAFPAMLRALKLQKCAASCGFDWPDVEPVLDKLSEEIQELKVAITHKNQAEMKEEIGDVLFSCVNIARHLKLDPEGALRQSNEKFYQRFCYIEQAALEQSRDIQQLSLEEMDKLWNDAKQIRKK